MVKVRRLFSRSLHSRATAYACFNQATALGFTIGTRDGTDGDLKCISQQALRWKAITRLELAAGDIGRQLIDQYLVTCAGPACQVGQPVAAGAGALMQVHAGSICQGYN
eukprot:TRINITY_DN21217_c0_g1_i1.p2 TRINITY_DN21217_c0_g1~~TRINITY_DN21217_c0_g1_i1.p2  ORF type:complete len:109 (+),score=23.64 TRINITY_DN21217_c0_g1_i1:1-327(+)